MPPRQDYVPARESRRVVSALRDALASGEFDASAIRKFKKGDVLFHEGDPNDSVFIILEGRVQLSKDYGAPEPLPVGILEAGDFVGLLSFTSSTSAFTTVHARTPVVTLCLGRSDFDRLPSDNPELSKLLQQLIVTNLSDRYRRIVLLHLEVATLTRQLELERNNLEDALTELKGTRNRLIHQEKMAILGQLVAGVAHEINNPSSAVLRSVDHLIEQLPGLLNPGQEPSLRSLGSEMLQAGLSREAINTEQQRLRMESLGGSYPHLSRTLLRTLSLLDDRTIDGLTETLRASNTPRGMQDLELLLRYFESGSFLRSMKVSGERIGDIVRSLKAYSRASHGDPEPVDVRKGIQDTLLIVGNRLKNVQVHLDVQEVPAVAGLAGELNQVWTNIILNACDAMDDAGELSITVAAEGPDAVRISFQDSGPGIPADILPRMFEPNFTTKTASGSFGLGLGLAIANEIVSKHSGTIEATNHPGGGAVLAIVLPVRQPR